MALPGGDHVSSFWECATGCFWVHSPALLVWTWKSQVYMTTEIGNHKIILLIFLIPNWNYYLKWQTLTIYVKFECKGWPARSPDLTVPDFFLRGFLKDRVFWRRIMTIQTSHCWRSCGYWRPTEARVRQLPDTLATMHWCKRRPSAWCNFQKISL